MPLPPSLSLPQPAAQGIVACLDPLSPVACAGTREEVQNSVRLRPCRKHGWSKLQGNHQCSHLARGVSGRLTEEGGKWGHSAGGIQRGGRRGNKADAVHYGCRQLLQRLPGGTPNLKPAAGSSSRVLGKFHAHRRTLELILLDSPALFQSCECHRARVQCCVHGSAPALLAVLPRLDAAECTLVWCDGPQIELKPGSSNPKKCVSSFIQTKCVSFLSSFVLLELPA